VKSDKE